MSFKTTPFVGLFLSIFEKGFSKEIDHLSNFAFSQFHTFSEKVLKFPASSSKGFQGFRVPDKILAFSDPDTLFRGVRSFIII